MKAKIQLAHKPPNRDQQPLKIHMNALCRNRHYRERRVAGFRNMSQAQYVVVDEFEFLAELVGVGCAEVGGEWVA